jgi:thioesterase domain-containing protein
MERFHGRLSSRQFAAALDACLGQEVEVLAPDAPAIFLFPPAGGADVNLTAFRAACAARLPVRQVRYPDLRALVLQDLSFRDIAAHAAHQIAQLKPRGALMLAGYSDGGDVAFEAARQLRASGRQVARLLILDTDSTGLSYPGAAPELRGSGGSGPRPARPGGVRRLIERMLPGKSLRTPFGRALLHLALRLPLPLPQSVAFVAALRAFQIRFDVLHLGWVAGPPPEPFDVPVVLYRSEEPRPGAPNDLGWARRTSNLTVVPVSGNHTTMLADERGLALAVAFTKLALAKTG